MGWVKTEFLLWIYYIYGSIILAHHHNKSIYPQEWDWHKDSAQFGGVKVGVELTDLGGTSGLGHFIIIYYLLSIISYFFFLIFYFLSIFSYFLFSYNILFRYLNSCSWDEPGRFHLTCPHPSLVAFLLYILMDPVSVGLREGVKKHGYFTVWLTVWVSLVNCPTRWSLLFIFGFLYWSSISASISASR